MNTKEAFIKVYNFNEHDIENLNQVISEAISEEKEKVCEWNHHSGSNNWITECKEVISKAIILNSYTYCPFCGSKIERV